MTLIKSISGFRGTIGGKIGDNLTPIDIVAFASAYGTWLKKKYPNNNIKVVVGRDARISGAMVSSLVSNTLLGLGIHVLDLGLSTTPTVEFAVPSEKAQGGIIFTASHNPKQWNALKLLNEKGEFLSAKDGNEVVQLSTSKDLEFSEIDHLGQYSTSDQYLSKHIQSIINLPTVNIHAIKNANFSIVVDAVNSSGGIFVPTLLQALGIEKITKLYCDPTGEFPHNPEPLPEHLEDLSAKVIETNSDLGITVDPDVDRLAMVCEDGSMFGEEYTLVAVADYVLSKTPGPTVSNLSSTRALRDITEEKHHQLYQAAAVGEVNVVETMKEIGAIIGGEGNGGVIYPASHYGRDALVGIALFLSHLAEQKIKASTLRDQYPKYTISKNKIDLDPSINVDELLQKMVLEYSNYEIDTRDGVKIYIEKEWVHLRKSNTEPIIRIYTESQNAESAEALAQKIITKIHSLLH